MAKNYLDIQNSAYNVGNIMDWTNALTRLSGVPVDITEVYDSYDKAVEYAAVNPVAYEGQLITVTENGDTTVYVITPAVQGTHTVGEGEEAVVYNVNIKKVGTVPTGDNASITVTEAGLVTLFGFTAAEDGMLPVRQDGKLTWKTLEAIGAGDGNDNTTYEFTLTDSKTGIIVTPLFNGQPIMEGEEGAQTQKKFELVLDVYTKAETDEKFLAKADYTPYDDTELVNKVSALESTINGSDDADGLVDTVAAIDAKIGSVTAGSTVVEMISAVEDKIPTVPTDVSAFNNDAGYLTAHQDISGKADKADTLAGYGIGDAYTKTEVDDAIDNAKKSILGEDVAEAYDTLKEIQDILQGTDGETIDGLIETVDANKSAIATLNGDASTEGSVDKKIADALEAADLDQYAVAETVEAALGLKANAADVVANSTFEAFEEANTQAITNARTGAVADIEAKGYAVAEEVAGTYATKSELATHASDMEATLESTLGDYAKAEDVEADLAKKIDSATISHTTDTIEEQATVEGTTLKIVVDAYTKAETLTKIQEKITEINGGESAGEVLGQLNSYIETNDARVGAIETKNATQDTAISAAQSDATQAIADAASAQAKADEGAAQAATNKTDLDAVKGRLTTLETAKGSHESRIAANEGQITSLDTTVKANSAAIGSLQGKDAELVAEDVRLAGLIDTLTTDKANVADVYTKGQVDTKVQEAIDAIPDIDLEPYAKTAQVDAALATKANVSDVYTKEEADTAFLTENEVDARINALINAADPEGGKTISNIQKLVEYVDTNAGDVAGLIADVTEHTTAINKNTSDIVAINALIAAIVQPKESAEISVATDGTLGIKEVNINKLVQTTGDTLVLNGGSAVNTAVE